MTAEAYGDMLAVVDPPAAGERRLILPETMDLIHKGIVVSVGEAVPSIEVGEVVHYLSDTGRDGLMIEDRKFINYKNVFARERNE